MSADEPGDADRGQDTAKGASRGAVDIAAWIAFALVIAAAAGISILAARTINADYRLLNQVLSDLMAQNREFAAAYETREDDVSSPAIRADDPPPDPVTWQTDDGTLITNPDWVERPSGADLVRYYPRRALSAGVQGHAVIECAVGIDGRLHDCEVTEETPQDMGFGTATLQTAEHFRMRPQLRDGDPVGGARVRIPLSWKLG